MCEKISKNPETTKKAPEKPKNPEANALAKRVENVKKISAEGKIARNNLKKEVEKKEDIKLGNDLGKSIKKLSNNLGIPFNDLINLIERESGIDNKLVSPTGAKGLMQLTTAPLEDMNDKSLGHKRYANIIVKLPDESIGMIKNKFIRNAFSEIKKNPQDKKIYDKNITEITKRAKENSYGNFLVGCTYLGMIKENVDPNDKKNKSKIIADLKKIDINQLNKMLKAKNKEELSQNQLKSFINTLKTNNNLYTNFVTYMKYNGDNSTDPWKVPHKYYFATAIINSKDKIA